MSSPTTNTVPLATSHQRKANGMMMDPDSMAYNPTAPDFVPADSKKGLQGKIESLLGPVTDENVKQLIKALEGIFATHETLYRNHSFQLIRLQSQVHELQTQRTRDHERLGEVAEALKEAHAVNSDLKGKIAKLTVDFHSKPDTKLFSPSKSPFRQSYVPTDQDETREPVKVDAIEDQPEEKTPELVKTVPVKTHPAKPELTDSVEKIVDHERVDEVSRFEKGAFLKRVQAANGRLDELADELLQEQRADLVRSLQSVSAVAKKLAIDTNWMFPGDGSTKSTSPASHNCQYMYKSLMSLPNGDTPIKQEPDTPDIKHLPRIDLSGDVPESFRQSQPAWASSSDTW